MRGKPSRRRYQQQYQQLLLERHADAVAHARSLADTDLADEQLCRSLALWVRAYRHDHRGQGPAWSLIAQRARPTLPNTDAGAPKYLVLRAYTERLLTGLKQRRWLNHDHRPGSTRQGPRLYDEGTLPTKDERRTASYTAAKRSQPEPSNEREHRGGTSTTEADAKYGIASMR